MATEYGVTAEGFKRKRLPEILSDIQSRFEDKAGVKMETGSNSVFGMQTSVIAYEFADIWAGMEGTYNAMYPSSGNGVSLTNSASLSAIRPIAAEQTTVTCTCYGENGTTILQDSQIADVSTQVTYSADQDTEISTSKACDVEITMNNVVAGTMYSLTIDGIQKTYTAVSGDTKTSVLTALLSQFSFTDRTFSLSNEILTITMNNQSNYFSIAISNLIMQKLGSPAAFTCDTYGSINPTIGNLSTIVTAVTGWNSVNNPSPANVGRDDETDTELRQRWSQSVYKKAAAMVEAIQANVYENVSGVTACLVYENSSDFIDDDNRPPHSVEVVVQGGDNAEIAQEIWTHKAGGIDTYGSVSTVVTDSQGIRHTIKFNRPTPIVIWLKIILTKNDEEDWAANNANEVRELVLKQGNEMLVGQDVILQKFFANIYKNTIGVGYVEISATTGETAGTYTTDNIVISPRELATFDASRIEVIVNE